MCEYVLTWYHLLDAFQLEVSKASNKSVEANGNCGRCLTCNKQLGMRSGQTEAPTFCLPQENGYYKLQADVQVCRHPYVMAGPSGGTAGLLYNYSLPYSSNSSSGSTSTMLPASYMIAAHLKLLVRTTNSSRYQQYLGTGNNVTGTPLLNYKLVLSESALSAAVTATSEQVY